MFGHLIMYMYMQHTNFEAGKTAMRREGRFLLLAPSFKVFI